MVRNRSLMIDTPRDPAASRYEHAAHGLRRSDLDADPIKQFSSWFTAAIEAGIRDVNAMSLATTGGDAKPSVRVVLLKGFRSEEHTSELQSLAYLVCRLLLEKKK